MKVNGLNVEEWVIALAPTVLLIIYSYFQHRRNKKEKKKNEKLARFLGRVEGWAQTVSDAANANNHFLNDDLRNEKTILSNEQIIQAVKEHGIRLNGLHHDMQNSLKEIKEMLEV